MDREPPFHPKPFNPRPLDSAGFTVLELLVVVAIVGVVMGLLLPAVMGVRESSRRAQCASHLRNVGIAIHHHHDLCLRIPAAWIPTANDDHFVYGWAFELLPEIEQQGLHEQLSSTMRPPHLTSLTGAEQYSLPLLLCPSDIFESSFGLSQHDDLLATEVWGVEAFERENRDPLVYLPTTNYVGVYGTVEPDDYREHEVPSGASFGDGSVIDQEEIQFADLQRGLSQTILVGERKMATVPSSWLGVDLRGEDAPCRVAGAAITTPNCQWCDECEFSSRHPGGSNFLWADGRVTLITDSIDTRVYRESARRMSF